MGQNRFGRVSLHLYLNWSLIGTFAISTFVIGTFVIGTLSYADKPVESLEKWHRNPPSQISTGMPLAQIADFLPLRFIPENKQALHQFKQIAAGLNSDSTHFWEWEQGKLTLSRDLLKQLLQEDLKAVNMRSADSVAKILEKKHGLRLQPAGKAYGLFVPNDEWYSSAPQWALNNAGQTLGQRPGKAGIDIGMEKVWDKFDGDDSLVIAIVDAGFNFHHPELKGRNWINHAESKGRPNIDDDKNGYIDDSLGWDFVQSDNYPQDLNGHGTFCSSVIAANFDNSQGIAGMVPRCRIMPIRVLDASGHGSQDDIAQGIRYAIANGADIINFSIGGRDDNGAMHSAFQEANEKGIPIIVAAGNSGINIDSIPSYPSAYPFDNLIVVGAHDHAGQYSAFSNRGKVSVDLAAPGEMILVAGIPDLKEIWREGFEGNSLANWRPKGFALSTVDPVFEKQSLVWTTGVTASVTSANNIDLTKQEGCILNLQLNFHPANTSDILLLEGNLEGTSHWKEIGFMDSEIKPGVVLTFGLKDFEGKRFKLRFRSSTTTSSSGRILKIDDLLIKGRDQNPADQNVYKLLNGTSIAAAHVSGYIGMQLLACSRLALPWTRDLALQGTVKESAFTDRVVTGGRLNAYRGLQFYLSTLPDIQIMDSTALSWGVGERIHFSLDLVPSPILKYQYSILGLGQNTVVDGVGNFIYTSVPGDLGPRRVTILAAGPTLLRKRLNLNITPALSVSLNSRALNIPGISLKWKIAGRVFLVEKPINTGRHWIQISGADLTGRSHLLKKGWLVANELGQALSLNSNWTKMTQIEVRLDGKILPQIE